MPRPLVPFTAALLCACTIGWSPPASAAEQSSPYGYGIGPTIEAAAALGLRPAFKRDGNQGTGHVSFFFIPYPELPIEDVDVVEVATPLNPAWATLFAWPVEGTVHFLGSNGGGAGAVADIPTVTPGVTGTDFTAQTDGFGNTWGVYQTLGFFYIYNLTNPPSGVPVLMSSGPLPGLIPQRRDIDPIIFSDPLSPTGLSAIFMTGNGLHCRAIPTGGIRWDYYLSNVMVEAVDPRMSPNGALWAPTLTTLEKIDPIAGFPLGVWPLPSAPVREIDVQFSGGGLGPGPPAAWMPTNFFVSIHDDAPGSAGFPMVAPIPMPGAFIEGNDLQFNPPLTSGYIPTLPFMVQLDTGFLGISGFYSLFGYTHQRNIDVVFNAAGPPTWAYPMNAGPGLMTMVMAPDVAFGPPATFLVGPGIVYDGVDAAYSDTPPFGQILSIATSAGTNVYNGPAMAFLGTAPRTPGAGPLRTDVDHKPGPQYVGPDNFFVQPTIGGLLEICCFAPFEWVVTLANGLEIVDLAAIAVTEWRPYTTFGMPLGTFTYRGGDGQPTFFQPTSGFVPPEPPFSVDDPDQDFITKCWEYKYALNRWPYWYSRTLPLYYPHYVPYGVFGPPALVGWDILNHINVLLTVNSEVCIYDQYGNPLHPPIPLPGAAIGGLIWDWDNKICKVRCTGQLEVAINLTPLGYNPPMPPIITNVFYGSRVRWYPVMDRMNGWEFVIRRGGRQLWVYDHYNNVLVSIFNLPARCIRRPIFDDQRKTLCVPLANRTVAFFNAHVYRMVSLGYLPAATPYLYYSPGLPAQVCAQPVFDFYNHMTICHLQGNQICILRNDTGAMVWLSPKLPYLPLCPIQVDCYNKIGKGFYQGPGNYYELRLDLYPLVFGGVPTIQWIALGGQPYGYPMFDSMDGFEVCRLGVDQIEVRSIFNPLLVYTAVTPWPVTGSLLVDRVNKYLLCALRNPNQPSVFYIDLYRFSNGDPTAAYEILLPGPPGTRAVDDMVFVTQHRSALIHIEDPSVFPIPTELVALNLHSGSISVSPTTFPQFNFLGLPPINKQMYVDPFCGLVSYPYYYAAGPFWGEVKIDMNPTTWDPPQDPRIWFANSPSPPVDAFDDVPPPAIPAPFIVQLPPQLGDAPTIVHYQVQGQQPGTTVMADLQTTPPFEPTEGTADDDGITEDISIVANGPEIVCFTPIDPAGNAGPPTCINTGPIVGVPGGPLPARLEFALVGENPARGEARFSLSLPSAGGVKLKVYDVAGRQVRTIQDGEMPAGVHALVWDLKDGSGRTKPGVFFAKLNTLQKEITVRVVVIQ